MRRSILFSVFLSCEFADAAYSTLSCDALDSCSPVACVKNSDANCEFRTKPAVDFSEVIGEMHCAQCTQSTSTKCQAMIDLLKKGSDSGVKAAYCTDKFFVIWSTGTPTWDANEYLKGIPLPPGGDSACRVRTASEYLNVYKIPLSTSIQTGSNSIPSPLPNVPGMPEAGAVGVGVDGVPIFPNYNNRGMPTWVSCEVDKCNSHSGKGEDYHYHGDPFGEKCLYSLSDYADQTHPPIFGFALDGYNIHGRYTAADQDGQATVLDACGGHSHAVNGTEVYHYHSEVKTGQTTSSLDGVGGGGPFSFVKYDLAPAQCWKGNVDLIDNFWNSGNGQANYDRSKGEFDAETHNDFSQLRACCGTNVAFLADGITLSTTQSSPGTVMAAPSLLITFALGLFTLPFLA